MTLPINLLIIKQTNCTIRNRDESNEIICLRVKLARLRNPYPRTFIHKPNLPFIKRGKNFFENLLMNQAIDFQ